MTLEETPFAHDLLTQKSTEQTNQIDKLTPVFKTDDFALYNDDCLAVMEKLPDNYVDMIFADPPYMLSNDGFTCQAGRMVSVNKSKWDKSKGFDEDFLFHLNWLSACRRILKPNGTIWVSGTYRPSFNVRPFLTKHLSKSNVIL